MIKVKDGYAKLIGTTYKGNPNYLLRSDGGEWEVHTGINNEANKIVRTNASGYLQTGWISTISGNLGTAAINRIYCANDLYIWYQTPANFFSTLTNEGDNISLTVASQNRKLTVAYSNIAGLIRSRGVLAPQTGRTQVLGDVYTYNTNTNTSVGAPATYMSVIGFGRGALGTVEIGGRWAGGYSGLWIRSLRDVTDNWVEWDLVLTAATYKPILDGLYVKKTGDTMTGPLIVKAAITGTQLISTIATGTSPLSITSTTKVNNLNSDLLDGFHETDFFKGRGVLSAANSIPTTAELAIDNNLCGSWAITYTGASGHLVQFNAERGSTKYMQFYSIYYGSLYWRNSTDSILNTKPWKTIIDSANYTELVLKIGTATKGSATLPIYLNAGTPTACSTTLGVSITGNAATATKLLTARTINGTSFDGTANIITAYWGTARTISLSGAVTGSASVNGSLNVTIATTYLFGSIDGRYVGGNKTANHGSSGTAYTADTYSSTFVNKAFVAFAERGSWAYANNGYVSTDTGVNIPLAGTAIFLWGANDTNKTLLYITPYNNSGVSNPAVNEMLFYTSNGSGYTSAWTRVLTHRNYTNYTVTKTGGGASGTWGISITGNAATATTALYLASNSRMDYGWDGLNYFNISGTAGNAVKVNDTPTTTWWHILRFNHANSSGYYTDLAIPFSENNLYYKRVANGVLANGKWVRILDELNYTSYVNPANFVTALGTSGDNVTWTKNGTVNNLTVPYSSCSAFLRSHDTRSTNNTPALFFSGARFEFKSNSTDGLSDGGVYHGILHFRPYGGNDDFSGGPAHLLGFTANGNLYMRTGSTDWKAWKLILNLDTANSMYVTSLGTADKYLTWTKAGNTNIITVPYATSSSRANYIYYGSISDLNSPSTWAEEGNRMIYGTYLKSALNSPVEYDNANGLITLLKSRHGTSGLYASLIAFPDNGRMYFRHASAGNFNSWNTVAFITDIKDPANYYWANVKVSTGSSTTTSPTFSNVYIGTKLHFNNNKENSIYNGPNDAANPFEGNLNNLVISSWFGISFTCSLSVLPFYNKNAVSINCRTGDLHSGHLYTRNISCSTDTLTSVTSINGQTVRSHYATVSTSLTFTLSSNPNEGAETHVIIKNTGSSLITITINSNMTSTYLNPIYIAAGKFGEVNCTKVGGVVYARAVGS